MFDSVLYGYGLTLAISNKILDSKIIGSQQNQFLFFNDFFRLFITAEEHKRIYRKFLKYFEINRETSIIHKNTKVELSSRIDEILSFGFERWVSKYLFSDPDRVNGDVKFYIYILYNYWAHLVYTEILQSTIVKILLAEVAEKINQKIRNKTQIYTTNFDTFLDEYLHPHHLHGVFSLPLKRVEDVVLFTFPGERQFEYTYLFGTNGNEKLFRLNDILKHKQDKYQLDFFYNHEIDLGHLLIFGLSFGTTEFISKEFLSKFPEHNNFDLMRSVDGHILQKLILKHQNNLLSKITISYHTNQDLEHLRTMFSMANLLAITDFKRSGDIFTF